MIEAVVGVALRAILASVFFGGVLALGVLAATRTLALNASTRHALWTTALVAIGIMPLAGIGVSLARAEFARDGAGIQAAAPSLVATVADAAATVATSPRRAAAREHAAGNAGATRVHPANASRAPEATDRVASARDAVARWTPRLSHTLAVAAVSVWALGALIGLIGLGASIVRVRGLKRRSSPLDGTLADELPWLTAGGPGREIYLRLSYETETPVAIGFRRPVILIPTELAIGGGLAAIEPLILHEYAHLRRFDDWTNAVQRVIERLFWFNPIVWAVGRRIALEREIASDDAVVEKTGAAHEYATSLWKLAREMRMPEHAVVAPGALLTRKQISVRIEQLLDARRARLHRSPATAFAVSVAALLAVGVVATSAPAIELPVNSATFATPGTGTISSYHARSVRPGRPRVVYERVLVTSDVPSQSPHASRAAAAHPPLPEPPLGTNGELPGETFGPQLGAELRRAMHEAMASVPTHFVRTRRNVNAHFDGMPLSRAMVAACSGCSMRNADLRGLDLHGLRIAGDDFTGADLRGVNLAGAHLTGVSLARANLTGADLRGASLTGVALDGTIFENAVLDGVKLTGVSLRHITLRGPSLRRVLANCTGCDFSGLDLHGSDLHGIQLSGADLRHVDLRGADLRGIHFRGVDLSGVKLDGADLSGARFDGCDLAGVSLNGAKTSGTNLRGIGLDG